MTVIGDMHPNHDDLRVKTWFSRISRECPVKGVILDLVQDEEYLYLVVYQDNLVKFTAEERLEIVLWLKRAQKQAQFHEGFRIGIWKQEKAPSYSPLGVPNV